MEETIYTAILIIFVALLVQVLRRRRRVRLEYLARQKENERINAAVPANANLPVIYYHVLQSNFFLQRVNDIETVIALRNAFRGKRSKYITKRYMQLRLKEQIEHFRQSHELREADLLHGEKRERVRRWNEFTAAQRRNPNPRRFPFECIQPLHTILCDVSDLIFCIKEDIQSLEQEKKHIEEMREALKKTPRLHSSIAKYMD